VYRTSLLRFFFHSYLHRRDLPSFPTRRSSDLDDHRVVVAGLVQQLAVDDVAEVDFGKARDRAVHLQVDVQDRVDDVPPVLRAQRSEEHTSELQSRFDLVCRLLLEKKKKK